MRDESSLTQVGWLLSLAARAWQRTTANAHLQSPTVPLLCASPHAGYQTHDGQGNVPTGAQWEKGTGAVRCTRLGCWFMAAGCCCAARLSSLLVRRSWCGGCKPERPFVWAAAGYDDHGQVKTAFGKFQVAYDPVSGCCHGS